MPQITPDSLMTLEAYSKARNDFRARVLAHKKNRTLALGEHVTLIFEDELTIRYQIQEMLRVERIFEESGIREIISRADKKALTISLKGASEEIRNRFFSNMSKRASELLKEEMEVLGAVRLREVEKAQQDIVAIARKLEEEGLITTGAGAGEAYVV